MASLPRIRRVRLPRRVAVPAPQRAERTEPDVRRVEAFGLTWLNIEAPTAVDTAWLAENFDFHQLDYEDVLSRRQQRSKIDEYDDYLFIILHFPRFDKRTQRLQPAELNMFVAEDLLITLPKEPLKPLSALFAACEAREEERERNMTRGSGYLVYEIVDRMFDYCFPILNKIGHKLDVLEDAIFEGRSEEAVRDISNVKQEIINYRKTIKPQRAALRQLDRVTDRYTPQDLEIYFDDIVDKNERIWDELENYKEVAEALDATNESVLRNRLNDLIRVLTLLSAVLLPLTLITGFYGMNTAGLPFKSQWWAPLLILSWMAIIVIVLVWYFRRKRWL
ncbi:MAG TPA: magnesium transporter CorA family protein [Miltoncostaeaceae bacterium]|nr:magnesium transporter CorA family protein [Miltoncostaeaceae bacterium]